MVNTAELDDSKRCGILAKKFEATLDKRTSKVCRDHDQRIIPIDKIKIGVNAPPLHPYCRSHLSDMLEGLDYDSEDELMRMIEGRNSTKKVDNKSNMFYNENGKTTEEHLQNRLDVIDVLTREKYFIPKNAIFSNTKTIALGEDVKTVGRLIGKYEGNVEDWSKKVGKIDSKMYMHDIHWYEKNGIQYEAKLKLRRRRKGNENN
ncbi:phage minor head protein [Helcococcus ovis]|uniref:phage minor head protein n=1 Tax=Helcococcus ovis TaxID=72026 RepID=UPI0038BC171C